MATQRLVLGFQILVSASERNPQTPKRSSGLFIAALGLSVAGSSLSMAGAGLSAAGPGLSEAG